MLEFDFGRRATQGAREYQEDSAAVRAGTFAASSVRSDVSGVACPELLAVLADGMGDTPVVHSPAGSSVTSSSMCSMVRRVRSPSG